MQHVSRCRDTRVSTSEKLPGTVSLKENSEREHVALMFVTNENYEIFGLQPWRNMIEQKSRRLDRKREGKVLQLSS